VHTARWQRQICRTEQGAAFDSASGFSHFREEDGWPISTALRPILGLGSCDPTKSAWDAYLFYGPGVTWVGRGPPTPTEWAHHFQANPGVGDRLTFATVARLARWRPMTADLLR
jgi:hypothetical protein